MLSDLSLGASQAGLTVTFLAYQAWLMSDAIFRTLIRLFITRKNLLEWVTAAGAKDVVDLEIATILKRMLGGAVLAIAALLAVILVHPRSLPVAITFALVWTASPIVARWISEPPPLPSVKLVSSTDALAFRSASRRMWRFFDTFVTPAEHSLPPDNFQEDPRPVVAHRTSPSNIGLYLLSTIAAHDLGWIGTWETVERLEATLDTMGHLERFRGHFYNWYDTRDLRPLDPKYVSSVDSGNIAGHLLAVANGCRDLLQKPSFDTHALPGAQDAIRLLREALLRASPMRGARTQSRESSSATPRTRSWPALNMHRTLRWIGPFTSLT